METIGMIACRMNSTRLYGKPMQYINGKHLLGHIIDILKAVNSVNEVFVATTSNYENSAIVKYCRDIEVPCFADDGYEDDVLGRFVRGIEWAEENGHKISNVIRVTGECPLHYIENVDEALKMHKEGGYDMTYTALLPLGAFLEIVSADAFKRAYYNYGEKYHEPRVTLAMKENPNDFKVMRLVPPKDLQRPELRFVVDNPEDLIVMREIYKNLYKEGCVIGVSDAIRFLDEHPEIASINKSIPIGPMARIWQ